MTEKIIKVYDDNDLLLLQNFKDIPVSPCADCFDSESCCGCPKRTEWNILVKPYEAAGITYDLEALQRYDDLLLKLDNIKFELRQIRKQYEHAPEIYVLFRGAY